MSLKLLTISFMVYCLAVVQVFAQGRTVDGRVTSADDGEGLPGVNVIIKGTTTGSVTDIEGNYKVNVTGSDAILVFSFVGLESQEVAVGDRSTIDVALRSDVSQLDEIVVTGTAAGQSSKTVSFAVGKIDQKLITEVPPANLGSGLQGKVSGLRVVTGGGQPGSGVAFQLRAANSLTAGQNPLIIVDGAFLNGSNLSDINPEDIERVEVLKGSAAASLYGSQAANGVIQIFTKRGRNLSEGETRVIYRGEFGVSDLANDKFPTANTHHFKLNPDGTFLIQGSSFVVDDDGLQDNPYPNFQDYQEQTFRNGNFFTNYLAVQGRSATTNFMVSAQRLDNQGVFNFVDGYERNSFRLNVDHQISQKFNVEVSSMYSTSKSSELPANGTNALINNILFILPIYDLSTPNEEDGSLYDWDIDSTSAGIRNPFYTVANRDITVNRTRLIGNIKANYDINDWLSFNGSVALDRSTNNFEEFFVKGFLSDDQGQRAGVQKSATNPGGGIERSFRINNSLITRLNAVVQKRFGDFNTAFRAGFLYEDLDAEFNSARGDGLAVTGIRSLDNVTLNLRLQSESQEIVANSFFGIADINYQEKYLFSALFRHEGSSLFGPDERWASYYRLSGGYRLTQDVDLPGIQELKLRASVGTAGIRPTFEQRFETFTLRSGSASPGTLGNNFLTPASSREIELGTNISFLDRFDFEFNYIDTRTEDQILRVPQSAAAGFTAQWRNAGTIDATTYEASLNTRIVESGNIRWNLLINFDRTRQTIDELNVPAYNTGPGNQQSRIFRIEEGGSFGAMHGQVFATSLSQLEGQEGVNPSEYTINAAGYVVRQDHIGTVDESPYKIVNPDGTPLVAQIGDINADFRMGFANTFSWKNVSLYALFDWKKGGDIYNQTRQWLHRDNRHQEGADFPIAIGFWNQLYNVNIGNSAFVEDGSFFMLRELSVGYQFNREQLSGIFGGLLQGIRIGFVGRNLFTITDYSGFHPDITAVPRDENQLTNRTNNGVGSDVNTPNGDPNIFFFDTFTYPQTRTFTGSLQITF